MAHESWSVIECIWAIWAYHELDRNRSVNKSKLFRTVAEKIGRSPGAVAYKVQNVSACDPRPRNEKPIAEMFHRQRLLIDLFHELWPARDSLGPFLDVWEVVGHRRYLGGQPEGN